MKTVWTKGLKAEEKSDVKVAFERGAFLRERLSFVIQDKMDAADRVSLAKEGYDCANWAYKQADNVGYRRAMQEILALLEK
jgi:hypothetical protein